MMAIKTLEHQKVSLNQNFKYGVSVYILCDFRWKLDGTRTIWL